MKNQANAKKARAVIVTIALIVATNFAISRAESVSQLVTRTPNSIGVNAIAQMNYPRPSTPFADDPIYPVIPPRPSNSFADDPIYPVIPPRPSSSFAADIAVPVHAPRPS